MHASSTHKAAVSKTDAKGGSESIHLQISHPQPTSDLSQSDNPQELFVKCQHKSTQPKDVVRMLYVRGSVVANSLPLNCLQSNFVYILTEHTDEQGKVTLFDNILEYISRHHIALVS